MLVPSRRIPSLLLRIRSIRSASRTYSTADRTSDRVATNDPNPPKPAPNVSETNALPVSAEGKRDATLQEMPEDAERQRQMQAPNRATIWSRSQAERSTAMSGPRFEQTIMEYQVSASVGGSQRDHICWASVKGCRELEKNKSEPQCDIRALLRINTTRN